MPVPDLIKAVRSGNVVEVLAALDAGASAELADGNGVPGLPLGIACFLGFADIARELVKAGAHVNLPDNREPISPLSMAVRGGRTEVVRLLVELGAVVPPGMQTGLSDADLRAAQLAARRQQTEVADIASLPPDTVIEEIIMPRAFGTDTVTLEADVLRAAREMAEKKSPGG